MKIVNIETTSLYYPHGKPIQDATISPPTQEESGRGQLFVHIYTDEGIEGLGMTYLSPGTKDVIENALKNLLIGKDPLDIEKLWTEMYWAVRGYGRKGIAFCAISAVDIGLWDLKAKSVNLPLYKFLGAYTDSVPIYGSGVAILPLVMGATLILTMRMSSATMDKNQKPMMYMMSAFFFLLFNSFT